MSDKGKRKSLENHWATFGKWSFVSITVFLFFSGITLLLGKIEGINRLAGFVLLFLGIWMFWVVSKLPEVRSRLKIIFSRRR